MVTPTLFSARNSMISAFSSVALVVRLKSIVLPRSLARRFAYAIRERGDDGALRHPSVGDHAERCRRRVVEREDRRARDEVQEIASRRLEQMEFARRQRNHRLASGSHLM